MKIPMFGFHFSFQEPGGDLLKRYGYSNSIGGSFTQKLKSGWAFGLDYSYIFGDEIMNSESYFAAIKTTDGYVIDGDGQFAEIFLYERGHNVNLFLEKQLKFWNYNPNSGPFVKVGLSYFTHFVKIENPYNVAPQVTGDYVKLYDHLTAGVGINEFFGYRFLSNNRLVNFYGGFELTQAFTQNLRVYNADIKGPETGLRKDLLFGIRIGWLVPIYGRTAKEYYYF